MIQLYVMFFSPDDFLHAFLEVPPLREKTCKKSSDETESIVIFSSEINLL